jgi:hypothetical protein
MQQEKLAEPIINERGKFIRIIDSITLTLADTERLHKDIGEAIECCNVATAKQIVPKDALFSTNQDPNVYVLDVSNQILTDFQRLRNSPGEDMRKTIIGLMDFYATHDQLNIMLLSDALENRQSYVKFTAQLANYLTHNQANYTQCRVQFDHLTSRLGIFCRKGTEKSSLNSNFLGSVTAALKAYGSAQVDTQDIPLSYLGNRASLKHLLSKRLNQQPTIKWSKLGVTIWLPTNTNEKTEKRTS